MGAFMFAFVGVGGFLPSTMGYTVKGSSNGTTGAMDGTNRITAASAWATQANGASSAISWIVLTDGAGVDWCFSYNSASVDICRLAHSQGGNYVVAGTATFQPTATDEVFDVASGTWINATASAQRVGQFWGSSDKKMFRFAIFRSSVLASYMKGEKFTSGLISPSTFSLAVGGGTVGAIKSYYNGTSFQSTSNTSYSATAYSDLTRAHAAGLDITVQAGNGSETPGGGVGATASGNFGGFNAELPALQGGTGELMFPSQMGCIAPNADGKLGSVIDQWCAITNASNIPVLGDTYGSLQFFAVSTGGGIIVPWNGSTTPQVA